MATRFVGTEETYTQGARTMPGEVYTSPEVFAEEERRLFRRRWLCVGREAELAEAGDFLRVAPAGDSVIVTRDSAGELHGFHNVCRHRGTRLCDEARGRFSKTIQCPYHAWTYSLDGRLVGAPHMKGVEGFDPRDYALKPVAVDAWDGFVFANLDPEAEPLEEWLEPLVGRFSRFNLPLLRPADRIEYDVRANWKLLFQNYSECQHCPLIHPELSGISSYTSGGNDLTEGPFLGGFMRMTEGAGTMSMSGEGAGVVVGDLPPEDLGRVYYYSVFPNLLLSLHPDYAMAHTLWPLAPDRTRIVCEWLFHPDSFEDPGSDPSDAVDFWDTTNRQDWQICEQSQKGIASRAYEPGPYSPRESLPAAWDREYRRQMATEGLGDDRKPGPARRAEDAPTNDPRGAR